MGRSRFEFQVLNKGYWAKAYFWGGLGMKKLFLFLFLVFSFFPLTVYQSQPPEYGLIFNGYKPGPDTENKRKSPPKKLMVVREKKEDGSDSSVFNVAVLPQFLFLATMQPKPVVVGIFSTRKDIQSYLQLADKLKDDALFISIDVNDSFPLVRLFFMILHSGGIDLLHQNDKFPLFLFCQKDFVALQKNGTITFKIGGIEVLDRAKFQPDKLLQGIKNVLEEKEEPETKEPEIEKEKAPASFWDKLRGWMGAKAKIFNKLFNMKHKA